MKSVAHLFFGLHSDSHARIIPGQLQLEECVLTASQPVIKRSDGRYALLTLLAREVVHYVFHLPVEAATRRQPTGLRLGDLAFDGPRADST